MKAISRELGLGGYMSNKEELLEAIEHYDVFTKLQKNVLKIMLNAANSDNRAIIPVSMIAEMCGSTKAAVYKILHLLSSERIIETMPSKKINTFILNTRRLEEIKEAGDIMKNIVNKKSKF